MSDSKRCKSCGNPVDLEQAQARDGACPWCLAAFTFSAEPVGNPVTATKEAPTQFGKYLRTEKLGAGGMGEVWKALDTELNRWVALKFLKDEDPSVLARFQREAKTAASLAHANIAAIYEVGHIDGRHFIAMQYIQGRTMAHFPKKDRRLIVQLFRDAARAVDHAHRHGIIHRDLKPDNLMVEGKEEEGWSVMVLDFGLARPIEGGEKLSQSGEVYGTAPYMSPEQARGEHLDERADVYGLGATMYDVLTGKAPFEGSNLLDVIRKVGHEDPVRLRTHNPHVHRDLETIVLKCLEKDRERRYASARELAEDLERFLNSDPIIARPPSTLYRLKMKLGKRKAQAAAAAAILALIATAAIFIPKWRSEAGARARQETAAREKRERFERARPHLEAGRKILQRMRTRMREAYKPEELKSMADHARAEFARAIVLAPDHPEAQLETAVAHSLVNERDAALEALGRAIAADGDFSPAYLERVRVQIDDYHSLRHTRRGDVKPVTPESKALLARLEADLAKVERFSNEFPQQKYAQALLAFAHGEYAKTVEMLDRYLEGEPEDGPAHYWRGHALYHLQRHAEALEAVNRSLAIHAKDRHALAMRGTVKFAIKDYPGAIADYDRAIEVWKDPSSVWFNRGNANRERGELQQALADFTHGAEFGKYRQDSYFNRAVLKEQFLGDFQGAVDDYTKAIELDPKDPEAFVGRASAKWRMGLWDESIADCDKAIGLDPKMAEAYNIRGTGKSGKGLYREAIADYTLAIGHDGKLVHAINNRGNAKRSLGLLDEALDDYTKAISVDPTDPIGFNNRGRVKNDKGLYEEAVADHTRAIELDSKSADGYMSRGLAKASLGLLDEAIADYTKAIDLKPAESLFFSNRGRARELKLQYDEALADYTKAIDLEPGNHMRYNDRGIARQWKGQHDDAIADFDKAIALNPKDYFALANRATSKELMGLFEEAVADLRKALEYGPPTWPQRASIEARLAVPREAILLRDGNRLHESKKYREAIAKFKAVVDGYPKSQEAVTSAYNIACAHALLGEKNQALDWLEKAVKMGWSELSFLEDDPDLVSLRGEARYRKVVEKLKSE